MQILGEIKNSNGHNVLKMFISEAEPRKNNFRFHKHTEFELSLILKGKGFYKVSDKIYDIKENDIFIFSTNEQHCITDIDEGNMKILNLHIQPSFLWDNSNFEKMNFMKVFFDRNYNFTNRLERSNVECAKIKETILNIKNEFDYKKPDFDIVIKQNIIMCLIIIMRNFDCVNMNTKMGFHKNNFEKIKNSLDFINDNYLENITLEQIAKSVFMPKAYFCTVFKKLNGITPWEYVLIKRIEKAIELLKTNDDNILNIALQCGFNNTANFNKIFKRITGTVPKLVKQ